MRRNITDYSTKLQTTHGMDLMAPKSYCYPFCLRNENCHKKIEGVYRMHRCHNPYNGYKLQFYRYRNKTKGLWRPWTQKEDDVKESENSLQNTSHFASFSICGTPLQSPPQFQHPVKLVWPKKPYDYMYAEGERLLRDFPVQATLEFAIDSDSETDDDNDDDVVSQNKRQSVNTNSLKAASTKA